MILRGRLAHDLVGHASLPWVHVLAPISSNASAPAMPRNQKPATGAQPISSAWLRHDTDIGLWRRPALGIGFPRLLIRHRSGDDHVFTLLPIHWRGDFVLGRQLQRIDHPHDLVE